MLMSGLILRKHSTLLSLGKNSKVRELIHQHEMRHPGICLRLLWIAAQPGIVSLLDGLNGKKIKSFIIFSNKFKPKRSFTNDIAHRSREGLCK